MNVKKSTLILAVLALSSSILVLNNVVRNANSESSLIGYGRFTEITDADTSFSDEFNTTTLDNRWTTYDPYGGSAFNLAARQGFLTLKTSSPPDRDLSKHVNLYAPRIIQQGSRNFSLETKVLVNFSQGIQSAGILLWKDTNNFLRLERAFRYDYQEILFIGTIDGLWSMPSSETSVPGTVIHIPNLNLTYLRLVRTGDIFSGYYSADGVSWVHATDIRLSISDPAEFGLYVVNRILPDSTYVEASFDYFRVSTSLSVPPSATFTFSPSSPSAEESVIFDASASTPYEGSIVHHEWSFGDGNVTTTAESTVIHSYMSVGNYNVTLTVVDSEGLESTTWKTVTVWNPSTPYSILTVSLDSSTLCLGYMVEISGELTCANGTSISKASILLTYSVTEGMSWNDITSVTSTINGNYSAIWMPTATGNYLVRASWDGNESIHVRGTETYSNLAVTPLRETYIFSVISNSTVSELAFNSTSRELQFTAAGPSGTTGYVKVIVAKSLIADISALKVYLDGNQLNCTITSNEDAWLIYFTYQHSTHEIAINLGAEPVPFFETPLGKAVMYGVPITAIVIIVLGTAVYVLKIRKKKLRQRQPK